MSESTASPVSVKILDREYLVACVPEQRAGLIAAASYLDEKMREIRSASRTAGLDRAAVMAGLNIAHELIQLKHQADLTNIQVAQQLETLKIKLASALDVSLK